MLGDVVLQDLTLIFCMLGDVVLQDLTLIF